MAEEHIRKAMIALRDREQECYVRYKVPGRGVVHFTVDNAGRVMQVGLSPPLNATPSGACLKELYLSMTFPAARGPTRVGQWWYDLPPALTRAEVVDGMVAIKPLVQRCYDEYRVAATAIVAFYIEPGGGVTAVHAMGRLEGTPTAACIEAAVRTAKFPHHYSDPMQIMYPFILR